MDGGLIGLIRWGIDSALALCKVHRRRRQPLSRQAARMLEAFEAHGVPPHQLPRLMPTALRLKPQQVTSPAVLADHLLIDHLDWTSDALALRRDWLDLLGDQPHRVVRIYKNPVAFYKWLEGRQDGEVCSGRILVLTEYAFENFDDAHGRFVVVYEERFAEIDDRSLCRYWYLSEGAHFEHRPCVVDLLGILTIAEHFVIPSTGRVVSSGATLAAENGTLGLVPRSLNGAGGWRTQDWVPVGYLTENCATDVHRSYWDATREELINAGLEKVLNIRRFGRT